MLAGYYGHLVSVESDEEPFESADGGVAGRKKLDVFIHFCSSSNVEAVLPRGGNTPESDLDSPAPRGKHQPLVRPRIIIIRILEQTSRRHIGQNCLIRYM